MAGTNTGDVTLLGENYLSLSGQLITANAVNLSGTHATGTLAAARFPALTGDITTSAGAVATTLATVNANVGTFGSSTQIPTFTVNAKGLITAASNVTLSGVAVTSITGTANQITASASVGPVTLALSSTIVTPGTFAANGALNSNSSTTLNATTSYNTVIQGTQTTSAGSVFSQSALLMQSHLSYTGSGTTIAAAYGITNITRIIANSGKTVAAGAAYHASLNCTGNVGTISNLIHYYSDGMGAAGTVSNAYGFYGKDPSVGTVGQAAYFDNLSVGYPLVDLKTTNYSIFANRVSIGASSTTELFNVGTANAFQINASGVVVAGSWNASAIPVLYGGTGQTSYTNGQLLIGNTTGNTLAKATLTQTANQVLVTNGAGSITLSTPQDIATSSHVQFARVGAGVVPAYEIDAGTAGTARAQLLRSSNSNAGGGLVANALICTTADTPRWGIGLSDSESGSNAGSNISFFTYTDAGGFLSTAIKIRRSNNFVGLGNIYPVNALDVNGAVAIGNAYAGVSTSLTDGLIVAGSVGIKTTTVNQSAIALQLGGSGSSTSYLAIDGTATAAKSILFYNGGSGKWAFGLDVSTDVFGLNDFGSGASRFAVDKTTGYVGFGSTAPATKVATSETKTLSAGLSDGYAGSLTLVAEYSGAQTVTRHNYIDLPNVSLISSAALTDAAVMRFNAAAGTHKAIDSGTTKVTIGVTDAWVKVNINGTIHYLPAYTSKTT